MHSNKMESLRYKKTRKIGQGVLYAALFASMLQFNVVRDTIKKIPEFFTFNSGSADYCAGKLEPGKKVIYVVDASDSMMRTLDGKFDSKKDCYKLAKAIGETYSLIDKLPEESRFNLVYFGNEVKNNRIVPVVITGVRITKEGKKITNREHATMYGNEENKKIVSNWLTRDIPKIKKMPSNDTTNTILAIEGALNYKSESIVLLTDGRNIYDGKYDLEVILAMNQGKTKINTVHIDSEKDEVAEKFLKELAKQTGGEYIDMVGFKGDRDSEYASDLLGRQHVIEQLNL